MSTAPQRELRSPSTNSSAALFASISAIVFTAIGIYVLYFGYPHEDAYILYIYSEMLSKTGDISYFSGGEPTEGATDFLWMVLIAALNSIGINSAIAALLLNSLGVFALSYLASRIGSKYGKSVFASLYIAILIPFYATSQAAYGGFSVALYSALIGLLFSISIVSRGVYVAAIPVIALILALFRPDGAIIGVLTCILTIAFLSRDERKLYFSTLALCALTGVAYFMWRWDYFGQLLPLPLIVKSQTDSALPGLIPNVGWANNSIFFIALGIASIFVLRSLKLRAAAMTLPVIIYMIAITFATQTQNVAKRFQAPFAAILLLGTAISLHFLLDRRNLKFTTKNLVIATALILLSLQQIAAGAYQTIKLTRQLTNDDYSNYFPYHLSKHTPESTIIALTEAGRFAYWLPGRKFDLVGLNTAETAINGASVFFIESLEPDLIFFHHAGTIASLSCHAAQEFCEVSAKEFLMVTKTDNTLSFLGSQNRIRRAPAAAAAYLTERPTEYTLYAARYGHAYVHVYAVRNEGTISREDFLSNLSLSFSPEGRRSYWQMVGE